MDHEMLTRTTATELVSLIAQQQLSPVEIVEAYFERIDRYDLLLSSYLNVCRETALAEAHAAERAVRRGVALGPLHGLPIAVKDQFATRNLRTTGGSTGLADFVPTEDATVVARAREAGAILIGKHNMAALGDRFKVGEPKNPWDITRSASGSSTGSAIAVAASLCAVSLGEDTGGSIRLPAAVTGIVGLRPTWGRVSRHGLLPLCWSMDTAGPMTRTVEDAALLLNVIAGYDPKDPLTSRQPVPNYRQHLAPTLGGLRIGLLQQLLEESVISPEVTRAVRLAGSQMERLGATVTEVSVPMLKGIAPVLLVISGSQGAFNYHDLLRIRPSEISPALRRGWFVASLYPAQALLKANCLRAIFRQEWTKLFDSYDALISPTTPDIAPKIKYSGIITTRGEAEQHLAALVHRPTLAASLAGTPALTIPCGFSTNNLPLGLQIMTAPWREDVMLRVGYAYEQSTLWHQQRPTLVER
ncbi:MAG: hypothetical protein L0387_38865 [Acidobacteria bacterium]|nr:hypothetical protein [Acidobacteriota bacterium]MCI0720800.1 hypothetical protein [Acidobacteriota bacterium]